MELKVLKINVVINWDEANQLINEFRVEDIKKKWKYLLDTGRFIRTPSAPQDSLLKTINQSSEFKNIEQNLWYFKDSTVITASELNRKFLNLYLKFEVQYLKEISMEIYVNDKEKLSLNLSVVNEGSTLKEKIKPRMSLLSTYMKGARTPFSNFSNINEIEKALRIYEGITDMQIEEPVLEISYSSSKPIITGGEVKVIGELKTLDGFDMSKFKFYISGEPEYPTPYVYRIRKYIN